MLPLTGVTKPSLVILVCGFQSNCSTNANVHFFPNMPALIEYARRCFASEVRVMLSENHLQELLKSNLIKDSWIRSIKVFRDNTDFLPQDLNAGHRISFHHVKDFDKSLMHADIRATLNNGEGEPDLSRVGKNAAKMRQMIEKSNSANTFRQSPVSSTI